MRCDHCPRDRDGSACHGESVPRLCELAVDREDYRRYLAGRPPAPAPRDSGPPAPAPVFGPGSWLAWGLKRVGFAHAAGCSCAEDAAEMDRLGPDAVLADLGAWVARIGAKPQAAHVPIRAISLAIRLACHAARRSAAQERSRV